MIVTGLLAVICPATVPLCPEGVAVEVDVAVGVEVTFGVGVEVSVGRPVEVGVATVNHA